jgi:hypothetical protein
MANSIRIRFPGHVALIGETRNEYRMLVRKLHGKHPWSAKKEMIYTRLYPKVSGLNQ